MPEHRPSVVLVQNSPTSGAGRLPDWLAADGIDSHVVAGDDLPDHLTGGTEPPFDRPVDGLVLLGGGFMPDDDERAPWLVRERRLTGEAVAAHVPVLGICLGAQLLANITGGRVTSASGEGEKGSCPIELLAAADDDALFSRLGPLTDDGRLRMVENHQDSITALPPGAVHLATSEACRVQAFRVGECAWGVQFHPEAAPGKIATWDESALSSGGFDRAALLATALADEPANERQARELAAAFARVVRAHRTRVAGRVQRHAHRASQAAARSTTRSSTT